MTADELRNIFALADQREEKRYAWLRQLVVLAAGSLTALVAFRAGAQSTGVALLLLRGAWISLGVAIVLGAYCLHGEVWLARELVRLVVEENKARSASGASHPSPSVAHLPARYRWAETLFYLVLLVAVVFLVAHAVLRDAPNT